MSHLLLSELNKAKKACGSGAEEQGGFMLEKDHTYHFIQIKNAFKGLLKAKVLYQADTEEFGKKVIPLLIDGWNMHASFHTHPNGLSANPSRIDLQQLFLGHQTNYIYAPASDVLVKYHQAKVNEDEVFLDKNTKSFISLLASKTTPYKTVIWQQSYVR